MQFLIITESCSDSCHFFDLSDLRLVWFYNGQTWARRKNKVPYGDRTHALHSYPPRLLKFCLYANNTRLREQISSEKASKLYYMRDLHLHLPSTDLHFEFGMGFISNKIDCSEM